MGQGIMYATSSLGKSLRWATSAVVIGAGLFVLPTAAQARDSFSFSTGFNSWGGSSFGMGYSTGGHWGRGGWGHRGWRGGDHLSLGFTYIAPPMYFGPRPYAYPAYPYPPRPAYGYSGYYPAGGVVVFSPYFRDRLSVRARGVYYDAYRSALDAPVGEPINWREGRVRGEITTTRDGWAGDRYCREFRQNIIIDGRSEEAYGTACRNDADTDWQIVPNQD